MITLYFTATGNSLYAARRIGGKLVSIPQAIKSGSYEFSDDVIGVVCPLYANRLPNIVDEFLKRAKLKAEYKFLIITYGHANFGADGLALSTYKKHGFNYVKTLLTVDNFLPSFDMAQEVKLEKHTDENLDSICRDIAQRVVYKRKTALKDRIVNKAVQKYFTKHSDALDGSKIEITSDCIGCGLCASVCPRGNIYIENGKAKRRLQTCEFCLACANLCPHKAIVCKGADVNPSARYINPNVTAEDIILSNQQ